MAMGSGTWQGSGTGTTTLATLADPSSWLCTITCLHWRGMAAPNKGQDSPRALRATHWRCRPRPRCGQGQPGHSPVVHVEEELEVELVHHAADLLPVTLHQLRVVHQLFLCHEGTEMRAGTAGLRSPTPAPAVPASGAEGCCTRWLGTAVLQAARPAERGHELCPQQGQARIRQEGDRQGSSSPTAGHGAGPAAPGSQSRARPQWPGSDAGWGTSGRGTCSPYLAEEVGQDGVRQRAGKARELWREHRELRQCRGCLRPRAGRGVGALPTLEAAQSIQPLPLGSMFMRTSPSTRSGKMSCNGQEGQRSAGRGAAPGQPPACCCPPPRCHTGPTRP